jgi:hypothetical protein
MDGPEDDRNTEVAKTENEFVGRAERSKTIDLQTLECLKILCYLFGIYTSLK